QARGHPRGRHPQAGARTAGRRQPPPGAGPRDASGPVDRAAQRADARAASVRDDRLEILGTDLPYVPLHTGAFVIALVAEVQLAHTKHLTDRRSLADADQGAQVTRRRRIQPDVPLPGMDRIADQDGVAAHFARVNYSEPCSGCAAASRRSISGDGEYEPLSRR